MYVCQVIALHWPTMTLGEPAPRVRSPRGEGAQLREQLITATSELLEEIGDASHVSVRAIARRAGVSPTALYLHFSDRETLVDAAVDTGFDAFNRALRAAGAPSGSRSPEARLVVMGLAYLDFAERQPALYATIFSARRPVDDSAPRGDVDRDQSLDGLVALLREADPALDAFGAREVALTIWAALHGFASLRAVRKQHEWPAPEAFVRSLLRAQLAVARI